MLIELSIILETFFFSREERT